MNASTLAATLVLGLSLASSNAAAQRVRADFLVRSGPIASHITLGAPSYWYGRPGYVYHRPGFFHRPFSQRVIVVEPARVIVVRRFWRPRGWGRGYWTHHGCRPITVWYDRDENRFYDRFHEGRPGLRRTTVYQRGGVYYRDREDD